MDVFKMGPLLERAVLALERIAINTQAIQISAKQIAINSSVLAGQMERPEIPLHNPLNG
jgi:hypothetical protein